MTSRPRPLVASDDTRPDPADVYAETPRATPTASGNARWRLLLALGVVLVPGTGIAWALLRGDGPPDPHFNP